MKDGAVLRRLLKYVTYETTSNPDSTACPSTPGQLVLGRALCEEMKSIGIADARMDENGYVYGTIPATEGCQAPAIAFVAHLDTSPAASGKDVKPRVIENYDGKDIVLNEAQNIVMPVAKYPELTWYQGQTLVVTDGTTLLGADDKAGIAEIMTMAEILLKNPEIEHGEVKLVFMPDEEIGRSADRTDLKAIGAKFGYTVDSTWLGRIQFENFNAASARVTVNGFATHPASAKGKMKNAQKVAMEYHQMLPKWMVPECTAGYEGFIHLESMSGTVKSAEITYAIRDFETDKFQQMKTIMEKAAEYLNALYGQDTVRVEIRDQYYNMRERIRPHMHLVDTAVEAMRLAGAKPEILPIRGCTDGVFLTFKGLPCPNLSTGALNLHSVYEYACVESMNAMAEVLLHIVKLYAEREIG